MDVSDVVGLMCDVSSMFSGLVECVGENVERHAAVLLDGMETQ